MLTLDIIQGEAFDSNPAAGSSLADAIRDLAAANSINLDGYLMTINDNQVTLGDLAGETVSAITNTEVFLTRNGDKG